MTTICAVKKDGKVAFAADSCTSFGDMSIPADNSGQNHKFIKLKGTVIGISGTVSTYYPLKLALGEMRDLKLATADDVYKFACKAHMIMKDKYFLSVQEENDQPFESSQYTLLIATKKSIFTIHSYRQVLEYEKFWAIGSGMDYALGALGSIYDSMDAMTAARRAVETSSLFDAGTELPVNAIAI